MSGFIEKQQEIDVWERTFTRHAKKKEEEKIAGLLISEIARFYHALKQAVLSLVNARNFAELLQQWDQFKAEYFGDSFMHHDIKSILDKIILVLEDLVDLEKQFPGLSVGTGAEGTAFQIFLAYIQEKQGICQLESQGIPVYEYQAGAGIGSTIHFIINMNQEDAALLQDEESSFLREDRKKLLGIVDHDLSAEFIRVYALSVSFPVFTVSTRTFTGPVVPHCRLQALLGEPVYLDVSEVPADPYRVETELAAGHSSGLALSNVYPSEIQKQGWKALEILRQFPLAGDLRIRAIQDAGLRSAVQERLGIPKSAQTHKKVLKIAPTDLNEYLECPFKWALKRGLGIREKQTEIKPIDQKELGILYHRIVERLFKQIQQEHSSFRAEDVPVYKTYLKEATDVVLTEAQSSEGAFQESIYAMLRRRIIAALTDYLEAEQDSLAGAVILGTEYGLKKTYTGIQAVLTGKADLVLKYPGGGFILTDFKTGNMPEAKELRAGTNAIPQNVQMAAYINMLEHTKTDTYGNALEQVKIARFYSIDNRRFRSVVLEESPKKKDIKPRIDYDTEVMAVDTVFATVIKAMEQGAYLTPENPDRAVCAQCDVSSVCRIPFIGGDPR
jgi:RecB family exonuclease